MFSGTHIIPFSVPANEISDLTDARFSEDNLELLTIGIDQRRFFRQWMLDKVGDFGVPAVQGPDNNDVYSEWVSTQTGIPIYRGLHQQDVVKDSVPGRNPPVDFDPR